MTVVRLKGIKRYRHPKTGIWYTYHRASGTRIKAEPGTHAFLAEIAALDAKTPPKEPAAGTLGLVMKAYRNSIAWASHSAATRLSYDRAMEAVSNIEDMPLVEMDRPFIFGLQEKIFHKRGRWMANYTVAVLSILFDYAINKGWMKTNPAKGVKRLKRDQSTPKANRPWSRAECRIVLDRAPAYLRVPIAIAMYTGLRKKDVLSVKPDAFRAGKVTVETSKRNVVVVVRVHPELAAILAAAPAHDAETIAANSFGSSWTESGFNSTFIKFIRRAEKRGEVSPGLTLHGLRHTLGTRLREAGVDLDDIRRILGQKTLAMAQHYSETADTSEKTRDVVENLDLTGPKPEDDCLHEKIDRLHDDEEEEIPQ